MGFEGIDQWIKTEDEESFVAVQEVMRKEGLLVGGSSGSALGGALRWLKSDAGRAIANTEGANVVVLLADGSVSSSSRFVLYSFLIVVFFLSRIRNYMSKPWFLNIAMEAPPSALAGQIADILRTKDTHGGPVTMNTTPSSPSVSH